LDGQTWFGDAATSMREIRQQWCNALTAVADLSWDDYKIEPRPRSAGAARRDE
jgi:hypothetical protein